MRSLKLHSSLSDFKDIIFLSDVILLIKDKFELIIELYFALKSTENVVFCNIHYATFAAN